MEQIKLFIKKNFYIIFIFICAALLRFYRLGEFVTFLSDQGRDAIIVKRIVTLSHLPAIGASSSVGQVYLGPFYYYLIAPFLLLFNFNPIGLAFGIALFSIIGIIVTYLIVKKECNPKTAFLFLLFISFSFVNIQASRFSWNPNLLPFFSFLTLYFFYKTVKSTAKKSNGILYAVLFGAFFSFSFQLHYLSTLLFLPILIFSAIEFFKGKKKFEFLGKIFVSITSFIFFSIPLIIFDLRHDFLNSRNLIKLFTEQGVLSKSSFFARLTETVGTFFTNITTQPIPLFVSILVLTGLFLIYLLIKKETHLFLAIHFVNIFTYLFAFSLLSSARHPHYFHPIYLSFFIVLSYAFSLLMEKTRSKATIAIVGIFFASYIGLNIRNCYFLYGNPTNQIQRAQNIADFLAEKIDNKPFNIATWPVDFFEDSYLYFLELKGMIPVDRAKRQVTDQMFVLCAKEPCQIINSSSWNISMFGKAKIDTIWTIGGIKIYKLIHENNIGNPLL